MKKKREIWERKEEIGEYNRKEIQFFVDKLKAMV